VRSAVLLHGVESSRNTWWRAGRDLEDLGWEVHALDLLGHGDRARAGGDSLSLAAFAADVAAQTAGRRFELIVGHSLGALVALTLAATRPGAARAVVLEDPPGLGGSLDPRDVADDIERFVARARADAATEVERVLDENPLWARADAQSSIASRRALNTNAVTAFLRTSRWDLPALVAGCPTPVTLLAATAPGTALTDPDRAAVIDTLPPGRVRVIASGHSIHRDRPALWLNAVLEAARSAAAA